MLAVEFSSNSNMLLVISKSVTNDEGVTAQISVWDFLEGHKDMLCKANLPMEVLDGRWNWYQSNEFVTVSKRKYHYWKISNTLSLHY